MARRIDPLEATKLGLRLRGARQVRRMTLSQVARACEMNHGHVSRIERGQFCFINKNVQKICTAVDVDPSAVGGASADELHARLARLIEKRPDAVAALLGVFDAFDQMAN